MKKEYIYVFRNSRVYKTSNLELINNLDNIYYAVNYGSNLKPFVAIKFKENNIWHKLDYSADDYVPIINLIEDSYDKTIILRDFSDVMMREFFQIYENRKCPDNQDKGFSRTFDLNLYHQKFSHLNKKK